MFGVSPAFLRHVEGPPNCRRDAGATKPRRELSFNCFAARGRTPCEKCGINNRRENARSQMEKGRSKFLDRPCGNCGLRTTFDRQIVQESEGLEDSWLFA